MGDGAVEELVDGWVEIGVFGSRLLGRRGFFLVGLEGGFGMLWKG